ncbi:glycosyltransferase [Paenibacillus chartarius]|uniref:Glycosyltransferase n=1 Tax=Paenibacillus chartarius TaxID=747481 RepID=A0ABV6DSJ4_9BACL
MRKKRILLLSEGFGAGHTRAAHALAMLLKQNSSEIQTRVMELGAFQHPMVSSWIFTAYKKTVTSQPKLWGMLYRSQRQKSLNRFAKLALHRLFYSQTQEIIERFRPDLIVCTHPFPAVIVSRLKRAGLEMPLFTVITDYDGHGAWIDGQVDKYFVSTNEVKEQLIQKGVPLQRIEVTGIPVHPGFLRQYSKDEIREQYGLRAMPTVLMMGGGWGMLKNDDLLGRLAEWREHVQLIIVCGSNEKARQRLLEGPAFRHPNVHVLGFTQEIDKLMDVSDLLITKPGGITCTEGMAKGLPMLFYNPIPGQEEENCQYFTEQGIGQEITSLDTIDQWMEVLLTNYPELARRRRSIQHRFMSNPVDCSQAIMQYLQ